jgi:hypothetical protein
LHIHITDATYKLLDRNLYEVEESSKTALNGATALATYFVLYKKDRAGQIQSRPFHAVLQDIIRRETEAAQLKQTMNIRATDPQDRSISALKVNGMHPSLSVDESNSIVVHEAPNGSDRGSQQTQESLSKIKLQQDSTMRSFEGLSQPVDSVKSFQRQSSSKTCELL